MKMTLVIAGSLALSMMVLAGLASADGGGACVAGVGFDFQPAAVTGTYVGVNVGTNSETGVYDNPTDYQTQCCAETGSPPDCFAPVG